MLRLQFSLCLPCRTYEWIVKGGEDVRMDERMEQLLGVANGLLARHPGAASHGLQVGGLKKYKWTCMGESPSLLQRVAC
jgi:hypothetical protein